METIRSASNQALKRVRAALAGREPQQIVLEGDRLVDDALRQGIRPELLLVAADRTERIASLVAAGLAPQPVEPALLARASSLVTPPGIVALAPRPAEVSVAQLRVGERALVVVAAGIQDPGNLGALARTAEAAGAGALVTVGGSCSPWNPKALRGSMGSLLRLSTAHASDAPSAFAALRDAGFRQVRAATRGGVAPDALDWSGRLALWLTAETGELGVDPAGFEPVTIPLAPEVESLNVTVAAAVLLFAAGRTPRAADA